MRHLLPSIALCVAAFAAGCANNSVVGGVPDAATDVSVTDLATGIDRAVVDVLMSDVVDAAAPDRVDAPPGDLGPTRCTRSADCAGDPGGPACDTARGRCVPCTDAEDLCPTGQYCVPMMQSCQPGCRNDDACATATGDGGMTRRRCDLSSRQCVECVVDEHCPAGNLCVGNLCVAGCSSARACPTGQTCCMGGCVDTQSNTASCGACGARCTVLNATAVCMNGQCGYSACTAPFGDCDRDVLNGCESNLLNDTSHCGACGAACGNRANASARCEGGMCRYTCNAGFDDCDGDASNGCETDTRTTTTACGACGNRCALANAESACVDGRCAVGRCAANFGDCDGNALNGCEADLRTSVAHCGFCNTSCPGAANAVPACAQGTCAITCTAGFADCDGRLDNGCEADTRVSATHCGGCGRACAPANGTGMCAASTCTLTGCSAGFADCDSNLANGCEVNTRSDVANCGTCSNRCSVSSGTAACVSGACRVDTCTSPFGDCDGNVSNGCETNTATSVGNCGACGSACAARANSAASCASGACRYTCNAGFADCDGNATNGCEVNLGSDLAHCGVCNNRCSSTNTTSACTAGACVVQACAGSFADCDGAASNGCETNRATSTAHCGACNNACPARANAATTCAGGTCGFTCNAGFNDCDDDASNGCETAGACIYASCNAVPRSRPSGVYALRTGGVLWDAYCDMTSDGGGWTLVLKVNGNASTFNYDSGLWTNTTLLNPTNTNLEQTEAKFQGFVNQSFSALRLAFVDGATRGLVVTTTGTSLRDVFAGGARATAAGRNGWRSLLSSPSQQPFCNSEGFNVGVGGYRRVRLGVVTNQENECSSPDSCIGIGFGSDSNSCITPTFAGATAGNIATCGSDNGDRNTRVFAYLFVR